MRVSGRTRALAVAVLVILFGAGLFTGVGRATGGSAGDNDDMAAGKVDVSAATYNDDNVVITLGFTAFENFVANDVFQAKWELDLTNNGVFGDAQDACVNAVRVNPGSGIVLRGTLQTGSGCTNNDATADSTQPTANSIQLQFKNRDIRNAGLSTGSAYNFRLTVTSATGGSDFAPDTFTDPCPGTGCVSVSGVVASASEPGAVQNLTAAASGGGQATVTWSAPASNGGTAITSYTVQRQKCTPTPCASDGSSSSVSSSTTSFNATGLALNTLYRWVVTANNAMGAGPSANSNQISFGVPSAPTGVTAVRGNSSATVSWTAPASDGGSPITQYVVTGTPGGTATVTGSPPATSVVVGSLANGTSYTFTVHATNANGNSAESAASNAVVPSNSSATAAPQNVTVTVQGVLTIARATGSPDTISFGTVTKGLNPSDQDAGGLDYTNTLSDDNPPWDVTVQATNLTRSTGCTLTPSTLCTIPYGNMTYKPASTIGADSGSAGVPVAASAGAFQTGPGATSLPKTISNAGQGTYGTFHQPDPATSAKNMIALVVPLSVRPGAYNGVLTYTITG